MLHRKQLCLARNSLGMLCHCQALSSGRCRFHGPLAGGTALRGNRNSWFGEFLSRFAVWRFLRGAGVTRSCPAPIVPILVRASGW